MNHLHIKDYETFINTYPEANKFLLEAHLRHEYYNLLHIRKLSSWQERRCTELSTSPACQYIPWLTVTKEIHKKIYGEKEYN